MRSKLVVSVCVCIVLYMGICCQLTHVQVEMLCLLLLNLQKASELLCKQTSVKLGPSASVEHGKQKLTLAKAKITSEHVF